MRGHTFAIEFDRGQENLRFFVRTKVAAYRRGLDGLPLTAVLVVTDRKSRMESLARAIGDERGLFLFTTLELIRQHGLSGPVFYRQNGGQGVRIV